jgi:hypothetical protein
VRRYVSMSVIVFTILLVVYCVPSRAQSERPIQVTVCQLTADPGRYNHALVQVSGHVVHAFELFSIGPDNCKAAVNSSGIWVEYGGKESSNTTYCCGATANGVRSETLVVEGIKCDLDDDATFERFDRTIDHHDWTEAKAVVIGRFFSGRQIRFPTGLRWGGYGHMGMYSLLVIQKVISVVAVEPTLVAPPPPPLIHGR